MTDHNDSDRRVALRALADEYARTVDAGDSEGVARLFTEDGRLLSHLDPGTEDDPYVRTGRAQIERALELGLARYRSTTHVVGGHVVLNDGDDGVTSETVCLAHHLYDGPDGETRMLVMAIRYEDRCVFGPERWRFAERRLRLDWRDDKPLGSAPTTGGER